MLLARPRYEAVIAAREGHVCFWTTLTQVNRFRPERDIHSQVKNLSYLKMTPCLNTVEKHEQTLSKTVKLFNEMMQN